MRQNKQKENRWEAWEPTDLVGWVIESSTTEHDGDLIKMTLRRKVGGTRRVCWVKSDAIPLEVTEREYK